MKANRKMLLAVLDGIGVRENTYGNAVLTAHTPVLDYLASLPLSTTLKAHGTFVGLPSDNDIGNSEVGHNALGAGRIYDQGAKIVQKSIQTKDLYSDKTWTQAIKYCLNNGTLHFLGLLSDGNVHSHESHLHAMLSQACKEGVKKIRIHILLDGRDVGEKTAEVYIQRLEEHMQKLRQQNCDVCIASGGGRMLITMDRYAADWNMVKIGWNLHVHGIGSGFSNALEAVLHHRQQQDISDQYIPPFVIKKEGQAVGKIQDGDSVICFNFRGDRSIEISQAFEDEEFSAFDRGRRPKIFYAGMTEYDGDKHVPSNYLVRPPQISNTFGEHLAEHRISQFACSETQKYGHVTFFWNGNRSGYFDKKYEDYLEIPSDKNSFDLRPWMKAHEITMATCKQLEKNSYQFGRINYANGDMVGHTGNFLASVNAVASVDLMLGRLIEKCKLTNTILLVTADHGNCDEMFEASPSNPSHWKHKFAAETPTPKTSHSLAEVPLYIYDPQGQADIYKILNPGLGTLANVANTCLELMGLPLRSDFEESAITKR